LNASQTHAYILFLLPVKPEYASLGGRRKTTLRVLSVRLSVSRTRILAINNANVVRKKITDVPTIV